MLIISKKQKRHAPGGILFASKKQMQNTNSNYLSNLKLNVMRKLSIILSLFVLAIITACNKDSETVTPGSYPYSVRMTDAPAVYDAVNIDLKGVVVTGSDGREVALNVEQGIYNLLEFNNGREITIANGTLTDAKVEQVRLILGSNNSVVVNGESHPLSTPSAQQSGLKIQVHQNLQAGATSSVLIDFDAGQSVHQEGNGTYSLKPVIRKVDASVSGSISGQLSVTGVAAVVTATNTSTNAVYTSVVNTSTGEFMIKGLTAGNYTVMITTLGTGTVTKSDIMVTAGATTNMGIVVLQ
jgi:hypothetical protein